MLTLTAGSVAFAHAELKTSVPEKNAKVKTAPSEVAIDFSEEVNPKLSRITVLDAKGEHVDKGDSHVAADDAKHMSVGLRLLAAGTYKVVWTSVAVDDGHKVSGSFQFTIAP